MAPERDRIWLSRPRDHVLDPRNFLDGRMLGRLDELGARQRGLMTKVRQCLAQSVQPARLRGVRFCSDDAQIERRDNACGFVVQGVDRGDGVFDGRGAVTRR
jgi:hypothetical protein